MNALGFAGLPATMNGFKSKADAIKFAIEFTVGCDASINRAPNYNAAQELFDFICKNVCTVLAIALRVRRSIHTDVKSYSDQYSLPSSGVLPLLSSAVLSHTLSPLLTFAPLRYVSVALYVGYWYMNCSGMMARIFSSVTIGCACWNVRPLSLSVMASAICPCGS